MSAPALHLTYIAVCIGVLVLVHRAPAFDLRSLRRRISSDERAEPPRFDLLERPDLGAVLGLLVIGGTGSLKIPKGVLSVSMTLKILGTS